MRALRPLYGGYGGYIVLAAVWFSWFLLLLPFVSLFEKVRVGCMEDREITSGVRVVGLKEGRNLLP